MTGIGEDVTPSSPSMFCYFDWRQSGSVEEKRWYSNRWRNRNTNEAGKGGVGHKSRSFILGSEKASSCWGILPTSPGWFRWQKRWFEFPPQGVALDSSSRVVSFDAAERFWHKHQRGIECAFIAKMTEGKWSTGKMGLVWRLTLISQNAMLMKESISNNIH